VLTDRTITAIGSPPMIKTIGKLLVALIIVGVVWLFTPRIIEIEANPKIAPTNLNKEVDYKLLLKQEVERQGLTTRDFLILTAISDCESGGKQFNKDGSVIISKGNIGFFQINRLAHEQTYKAMKLDMAKAEDNIKYGTMLYKKNGLRDWQKWSGWCFEPRIQGIK